MARWAFDIALRALVSQISSLEIFKSHLILLLPESYSKQTNLLLHIVSVSLPEISVFPFGYFSFSNSLINSILPNIFPLLHN